jgi:HEPN domain-containing protein
MKRAKSNLARLDLPKNNDIVLEDLCFDAQQTCEKALKAVHIAHQIKFKFVLDLTELLRSLREAGISIPENVRRASELTDYATVTRYPGWGEPVTQDEFEKAKQIAEEVFTWAQDSIPDARQINN